MLVNDHYIRDQPLEMYCQFCSRYPEIFSKFAVSIRKHVEDGICLPTVAIRSLSNKVSNRTR